MTSKRAVGIDLGTTYSVAAWIDGTDRTTTIPNREGDILTPSTMVFDDDDISVGKEAKKLGVMKTDRLAECVKRDMGNPFYSRPIDGEYLPPELIQACLLRKLRQDITDKIGPDFGVVITVPAFFDDSRRRATAVAGEIAGLHVLDIVNEPVAGALAFGEQLGAFHPVAPDSDDLRVLVYDLGGGTFDVSLLEINEAGFRTLATDGDVHLGGRDWDMRLVDMASEQFANQYREDPRANPVTLQRLLSEVEQAKQTLSARQRGTVRVDHAGTSLETEVTRAIFEERTANLLERTEHTTRQLIVTAGLEWHDVTRILLVGGATRMPMVSSMLKSLSGITPERVGSPDEAVARGAAIYAKYLLCTADGSSPRFTITNVNAHNLGIQGVERDTRQKVNAILIPRNTPLPTKTTRRFVTHKDNQRSIAVLVLEGENVIPSECTVIGRAVIDDLPENLPAGHPVDVTYEYASNGRLHVRALVPGVKRDVGIELERGARLPDDWIAEWKKTVSGNGGLGAFRKVLNRQEKRRPWRQISRTDQQARGADRKIELNEYDSDGEILVAYDGVVVSPEQRDQHGRLQDGPLELDRTLETVSAPQPAQEGEDSAVSDESLAAAYSRPRTRRRRRPMQTSVGFELVKIVIGGVAGLAIGQLIVWWALGRDPLDVVPRLPPSMEWFVPEELLDQAK